MPRSKKKVALAELEGKVYGLLESQQEFDRLREGDEFEGFVPQPRRYPRQTMRFKFKGRRLTERGNTQYIATPVDGDGEEYALYGGLWVLLR